MTSFWRYNNVIITPCVQWVIISQLILWFTRIRPIYFTGTGASTSPMSKLLREVTMMDIGKISACLQTTTKHNKSRTVCINNSWDVLYFQFSAYYDPLLHNVLYNEMTIDVEHMYATFKLRKVKVNHGHESASRATLGVSLVSEVL